MPKWDQKVLDIAEWKVPLGQGTGKLNASEHWDEKSCSQMTFDDWDHLQARSYKEILTVQQKVGGNNSTSLLDTWLVFGDKDRRLAVGEGTWQ